MHKVLATQHATSKEDSNWSSLWSALYTSGYFFSNDSLFFTPNPPKLCFVFSKLGYFIQTWLHLLWISIFLPSWVAGNQNHDDKADQASRLAESRAQNSKICSGSCVQPTGLVLKLDYCFWYCRNCIGCIMKQEKQQKDVRCKISAQNLSNCVQSVHSHLWSVHF